LSSIGQKEAAITSFDKAIELKPDYHEAWNNRGIALFTLGQHEAAIASYDKAIELKPNSAGAHYNKACYYALQGDQDAAIASLQRAIELDKSCREMAKADTDFDGIRDNEQFQVLIGS